MTSNALRGSRKRLFAYWPVLGVALFWTTVAVLNFTDRMPHDLPASVNFANAFTDFDALFAGGLVALEKEWSGLYGQDVPLKGNSITRPHPSSSHASAIARRGGQYRAAWLYPPPAAVLFAPLAVFRYITAQRIWIVMNGIALLVLLCLVTRELQDVSASPIVSSVLILLLGISFPVGANFNTQNLSIFFAIAIMAALFGIQQGENWGPALATVFLGVTKGFSIVWIPVFLAFHQWRILLRCIVVSFLLIGVATALGCGWSPYHVFLNEVIPAVRSGHFPVSDAFPSVLCKLYPDFSNAIRLFLNCCWGVGSVFLYVTLLLAQRATACEHDLQTKDLECLALMLSVLMFQAFSDVSWVFYRVHIIAFVPLLYRLGRHVRNVLIQGAIVCAMCLIWFPIPFVRHSGAIGLFLLILLGFVLYMKIVLHQFCENNHDDRPR